MNFVVGNATQRGPCSGVDSGSGAAIASGCGEGAAVVASNAGHAGVVLETTGGSGIAAAAPAYAFQAVEFVRPTVRVDTGSLSSVSPYKSLTSNTSKPYGRILDK